MIKYNCLGSDVIWFCIEVPRKERPYIGNVGTNDKIMFKIVKKM